MQVGTALLYITILDVKWVNIMGVLRYVFSAAFSRSVQTLQTLAFDIDAVHRSDCPRPILSPDAASHLKYIGLQRSTSRLNTAEKTYLKIL